MNSGFALFGCWVLLTAGSMAPAGAADAPADQESVTTRWLPDPFPNVAPCVRDRHTTVALVS